MDRTFPHSLHWELSQPPFFNAVDLKSKGSSTKISQTMELDVSSQTIGTIFLGLGPIARLSMTLKLRKGLKRLKARLEAG